MGHSARSTGESHLAEAGTNGQEIIEIMGTSSPNLLKSYQQLFNEHLSNSIDNPMDRGKAITFNGTEQKNVTQFTFVIKEASSRTDWSPRCHFKPWSAVSLGDKSSAVRPRVQKNLLEIWQQA
ncbi:hypothetical protein JTB14_007129 [Gonioctena quinquepunctata]|nr:hypothetical protein JTB14_007129 [Gonioctena quinquepunctata]